MRVLVLILIVLLFCLTQVHAQNSVSIGMQVSPAFSKILDKGTISDYNYRSSVNFGVTVDVNKGRWTLSTGVSHQILGAKYEAAHTTTDFPGGTGDYYNVFINTNTVVLPLRIHYNIPLGVKLNFFPIAGVQTGYMYAQKVQFTNPFDPPAREREFNIGLYSKFYLALFAGTGFKYTLNQSWSLDIIPGCSYQIDTLKSKSGISTTQGILAFSMELGVKYKLR